MEHSFTPDLLSLVRPILILKRVAGTCPISRNKDGTVVIKLASRNGFHTLLVLTGMFAYFINLIFQMYHILIGEEDRSTKITKAVAVASYLYATLTPIVLLLHRFQHRVQYMGFFKNIEEYRKPLGSIIDPIRASKVARKIVLVYFMICLSVSFIVVSIAWNCPRSEGMLLYFYPGEDPPPQHWVIIGCVLHCYLVLAQYSSCAVIEVVCTIVAISMENAIKTIQADMISTFEKDTPALDKMDMPDIDIDIDASVNHVLFQRSKEAPLTIPYTNFNSDFPSKEKPGTRSLIKSIQNFYSIVRMESLISATYGNQLALNTALHIFLTCCYFFLLLTNYSPMSGNSSSSGPNWYAYMILWSSACILIRIFMIFLSFGNFHQSSVKFTASLSEQFLREQLMGDGSGSETSLLTSENRARHMQVISAFLASQNSNPSCISAGGYFVFSRQSLVAAFSIVITYVIFLVQVKQ